jgi:hypothetical protein
MLHEQPISLLDFITQTMLDEQNLIFVTSPVKAQRLPLKGITFPTVYVYFQYYNLQEMLPEANFFTLTLFVTEGMRSEGNTLKNAEPIFGFYSRQCSSTPLVLVKDLFNQEQCDNNVTSPIFS